MSWSPHQWQLLIALIVASMNSASGSHHQYEYLFYILVVIFGGFDMPQFLLITMLMVVLSFYNDLSRKK